MTQYTKRAIEIITPIANELNLKVSASDRFLKVSRHNEDDVYIGISCNSTYATLMECKRERIKLQKQKQKPNNNESIVEISKKAKEMGLSYGEYVARGINNE